MTDLWTAYRQLERTMYRAWPSFEAIEYDGWVVRFADGYTKRANSVNPQFGSTLPLPEKIAHCEGLYAERGLPTIFRLTPFSQPEDLDRTLTAAGYTALDRTLVMEANVDRRLDTESERVVHVSDEAWRTAFDRLHPLGPSDRAAHHRIVRTAEGARCFATVEQHDESIACGLGVLVDDAVGLFDLFTAEASRRRGHGAAIARSILRWAYGRGARTAFLQVHSQNDAARRLYRRLGFEIAYPYWYRLAP